MTNDRNHIASFSARDYYNEVSTGVSHRRATQPDLSVLLNGLHIIQGGSLEWIDGLFVENLRIHSFLSAIKEGVLPRPCLSETPHLLSTNFTYCSPEVLAYSQSSILGAFGIGPQLVAEAISSPSVVCPQCGGNITRLPTPLAFLDTLLKDWAGHSLTLSASSTSDSLKTWAADFGFNLSVGKNSSSYVVDVYSFHCTQEALTHISQLTRALWRVPGVVFICSTSTQEQFYAPQGWCTSCNAAPPLIRESDIKCVISQGVDADNISTLEKSALGSLLITPSVMMKELGLQQIQDLEFTDHHILKEVCKSLVSCGLGKHHLLAPVSSLTSREIAALSVAASLHLSANNNSVVLVDLPAGIFSSEDSNAVRNAIIQGASSRCLICLNDPFAPPERFGAVESGIELQTTSLNPSRESNGLQDSDFEISPGKFVALSNLAQPPALSINDLNDATARAVYTRLSLPSAENTSNPTVFPIPIFPSPASATHVLGDELRCMDKLANLYASSVDARTAGLAAKDFLISSPRSNPNLCKHCKGLGVTLEFSDVTPRPRAAACTICAGSRFTRRVSSVMFKGVSYQRILNQPVRESADTLRALGRVKAALELADALNLSELPLGMPLILLSSSELRRLLILRAVLASQSKKTCIVALEGADIGFSPKNRRAILQLQTSQNLATSCAWIELP